MGQEIHVSGSYMKPTNDELMTQYLKAILSLTVIERQPERVDRIHIFFIDSALVLTASPHVI